MTDITDGERFDFEREKWRAELDMRGREFAIKEREQAGSKWRSPITVAILAAAVAGAGNAVVAIVNGTQQLALENSKAESTRIFEMIKTGDPEHAARNLEFLLQSGLITDAKRAEQIAAFLKDKSNAVPVLPSASGRVAFEPSGSLSGELQKKLEKLLQDYLAYLDKIGFPAVERASIKIEPMPGRPNAFWAQGIIAIDPKLATDSSVPLREYNHHLLGSKSREAWKDHYGAIESGLADYLACSFLNTPRFGEVAAKIYGIQTPYIRLMANDKKFSQAAIVNKETPHDGGEIWSGAFWAIRAALGREGADSILAAAWPAMKWPTADAERPLAFTTALLNAAKQKAPQRMDEVKAVLQGRGFPLPR